MHGRLTGMHVGDKWGKGLLPSPQQALAFVYSLICHSVLFFLALQPAAQYPFLPQQIQFIAIVSCLLSFVWILAKSRNTRLCCQVFRSMLILLAVFELEGIRTEMEVLLLFPSILEVANRNIRTIENGILAITLFVSVVFDCLHLHYAGTVAVITHTSIILVVTIPILLFMILSASRSHQLLESQKRIQRLNYAIENLSNANKNLQNYAESSRSLAAGEERNRITRDLHDLVGYALTNVIMLMNATKILLLQSPERLAEAVEMVEQTKDQAEAALQDARRILYELRAASDRLPNGLHAIAELVKVFQRTTHIAVGFHYGNLPISYGRRIDAVMYQIVQEGLTNAIRHGKADEITISLWETDENITISVKDNGVGADRVKEGIGLKGMRERVALFGGNIDAHGESYGFVLAAYIPLRAALAVKDEENDAY